MATQIPPGKAARIRVSNFRDASGNPTTVDGTQSTVTLSDETAFALSEVQASGTELSCKVTRTGPEGTTQVQLSPDVDRDPTGVKVLPFLVDLETLAGEAVGGDVSVVLEDA